MAQPSDNFANILLAEDNPADQRLIAEALKRHHLNPRLQVVENGEAALSAAKEAGHDDKPCPDVFILDLHMPRVDGLDVLREFRANEHCQHTPVIVFTSSVSPVIRTSVESFNGVRIISKPTDLDEFLAFGAVVKSVLMPGQAAASY